MKPSSVCLPRLFVYPPCVVSSASWVSCAFSHTVPDALSRAFFCACPKFTQFHCKQLRVFPLWFPGSAVFRSSCIQSRFFSWIYLGLSLSSTLTTLYIPRVFPYILRSFRSICSAIRNHVYLPLGYWTFSVLSLTLFTGLVLDNGKATIHTAVCSLHFTLSLHITHGPQSALYTDWFSILHGAT